MTAHASATGIDWKLGDEFLPFHPDASHISPEYRDGWNACYLASIKATLRVAATPPQPAREVRMLTAEELDGHIFRNERQLAATIQRKFAEVNGLTLATPQGEQQ